MMPRPSLPALWRVAGDVLLALFYALFAYAHLQVFLAAPRASPILLAVFESLVVFVALSRREPQATQRDWRTIVITGGGMFMPLLLRPVGGEDDLLAGTLLQLIGLGLQFAAILSLGRSFGLLPADRGVRTGGLYRMVRHPLYLSYLVSQIGYLANNASLENVALVLLATLCQIARIHREEEVLSANAGYAAYKHLVSYRLLPGLW